MKFLQSLSLAVLLFLISCQSAELPTQQAMPEAQILPSVTVTKRVTEASVSTSTLTAIFTPTRLSTATPDTRLTAHYWREWPDSVILADSLEQAEQLPAEVLGDEVILVAGHNELATRVINGFWPLASGPTAPGVGHAFVMRRMTNAESPPAATLP